MRSETADLVRLLADEAEVVCRFYLSSGKREGRYWLVGDVHNAKGRSLFVRLTPTLSRPAGKWTDAATGEHGDLLDIIAASIGSSRHSETLAEARRFLAMPARPKDASNRRQSDSAIRARRLFATGESIAGTIAEIYLRTRAIRIDEPIPALRFHPACRYRASKGALELLPAMIAAVTDNDGALTGVLRTYLAPGGRGKASILSPRRALGALIGNGVRFGATGPVMAAGEGIETLLSLRAALPSMPMIAALSAAHLAALRPALSLRRLYIAVDRDAAGESAAERLSRRIRALGLEAIMLEPQRKDFNDDLIAIGVERMRASVIAQLHADDQAHVASESGAS